MNILVVEDERNLADAIVQILIDDHFNAEAVYDGNAGLTAAQSGLYDAVVLDIMLPGDDGLEILRKLKANPVTKKIPVIMTTAKGTEFDKVIGLDTGADDYLTKPFGMMEMIARVNAVLRRVEASTDNDSIMKHGDLTLNSDTHKVTVGNKNINLTLKEFELLQIFLQSPGYVFTRENLLANVWGVNYAGETRTVDVHIGTLRTKLGGYGKCIETVRGVGYRLSEEK